MLPEKEYYLSVENYIIKEFNCMKTGIGKGYLALGIADVIGAYEISTEFHSDIELIIAEVKTTASSFGKSLGQALGYSIYGERCYLAITFHDKDTFTKQQQFMANHLGVGLIRIPVDNECKPKKHNFEMVLNSKKHIPIDSQKQSLLHAIGISKCSSCGVINPVEKMQKITKNVVSKGLFTNSDIRSIFLCDQCYCALITQSERLKREIRNNSGKKAAKTRKYRAAARKAIQTRKPLRGKITNVI